MEKGYGKDIKKIVITGAESTGKSTLTKELASHFKTSFVPEYARTFVENLDRKYDYEDLTHIAQMQMKLVRETEKDAQEYLFIDTFLIIMKIWFEEVFNKYPEWIDDTFYHNQIDLYLVCNTDIPWISDSVRENGGLKRENLHKKYINQLDYYKLPYKIVSGVDSERTNMALKYIHSYFTKETLNYGNEEI